MRKNINLPAFHSIDFIKLQYIIMYALEITYGIEVLRLVCCNGNTNVSN